MVMLNQSGTEVNQDWHKFICTFGLSFSCSLAFQASQTEPDVLTQAPLTGRSWALILVCSVVYLKTLLCFFGGFLLGFLLHAGSSFAEVLTFHQNLSPSGILFLSSSRCLYTNSCQLFHHTQGQKTPWQL